MSRCVNVGELAPPMPVERAAHGPMVRGIDRQEAQPRKILQHQPKRTRGLLIETMKKPPVRFRDHRE